LQTTTIAIQWKIFGVPHPLKLYTKMRAKLLCERGAGRGDFEGGEQELKSEFYKYRISTKNRNFDGRFSNFLFLVKIGIITVDSEYPSTLLNGRYSVIFFALDSCIVVNSIKGVLATMSINARTWCPRPLWSPSFTIVA
jgi:hypothetical protein